MSDQIPALISIKAMVRAGLIPGDEARLRAQALATGQITERTPAVIYGGNVRVPFARLCDELGLDPAETAERLPKRKSN
jgi:hypothetical protein